MRVTPTFMASAPKPLLSRMGLLYLRGRLRWAAPRFALGSIQVSRPTNYPGRRTRPEIRNLGATHRHALCRTR